jgi:iron complex outermembrane receptor protein
MKITARAFWAGSWLLCSALDPATATATEAPAGTNLMELSFEQLLDVNVDKTSAASRYEQTLAQAPANVSIVTRDEIKKTGARNLGEVLATMRGLYINYDRNYTYLGVRGFSRPSDYNSRVLLLVDGQRLNDGIYDQAPIGNDFPVDIDLIERIEVVHGPSSAVYGNNAFFGVINIITRRGAAVDGAEASVSGGAWNTWHGRFTMGKKYTNGVEVLVSGSVHYSEGQPKLYYPEFNTPTNHPNNGVADYLDREFMHDYRASVSWHDWTLEGLFSLREKNVPTAAYSSDFNDSRYQTTDERALLGLKYHHIFGEGTEVNAKTYYDYYSFDGDYPTKGIVVNDTANAQMWGNELGIIQRVGPHTFSAGAEVKKFFHLDQKTVTYPPPTVLFDQPAEDLDVGAYAQADIQICKQLTLSAGGRYDWFDRFGDSWNPRAAIIWQPVEATTLKLLYGTAFRAPNAYELYYSGADFDPARPVDAEKISTYEGVWEQRITSWLRFTASGFYYDVDGLIEQVVNPGTGLLTFHNLSEAHGYGGEIEFEARHHSGALGRISYTEQRTEDGATGARLINSPARLVKFTGIVPVWQDKLFASAQVQYVSTVIGSQGDAVNGWWLVNTTVFAQKLAPGLEVSAGIYNLFDNRYAHASSTEHLQNAISQDGRSFRVQATWHF